MKPDRKLLHNAQTFVTRIICICGLTSVCTTAIAQTQLTSNAAAAKSALTDTALKKGVIAPLNDATQQAKQVLNTAKPEKNLQGAEDLVKKTSEQIAQQFSQRLGLIKKTPITLNLALENAFRYQPVASFMAPIPPSKFVNVISATGAVQLFGIPLSVNLSSNQRSNNSHSGFNNLLKFDLDPQQFSGLYLSDWQRFYDLRKNVFGGADLTGYTQKLLNEKLANTRQSLLNPGSNAVLATYLSDPKHVEELLHMDEEQIKAKLLQRLKQDSAVRITLLTQAPRLEFEKIKDQAAYVERLKLNADLSTLLRDPVALDKLKKLPESEMKKRLHERIKTANLVEQPQQYVNAFPGIDFGRIVNYTLQQKQTVENNFVDNLAHQLSANSVNVNIEQAVAQSVSTGKLPQHDTASILKADNAADLTKDAALGEQISKVTATISGLKRQLTDRGYDVGRLLQVQQIAQSGFSGANLSEAEHNLITRLPSGKFQRFISAVSAFKLGSFSNQVPGNTQGQDVFMNGAHATFRFGRTPVTIGYGSQNDIQAAKDVGYQSTVYNSPKNLTYLGAELKGGWGGPLKISVIGSVNKQYNYDTYRLPTVSSNNVALTLSKNYRMGKFGDALLEVSKTTTLYANKYDGGNETLLDKKAGIYNVSNDLFQSLAFSFNHQLSIKELGLSDRLYFSYSGMGYQNPGNNGFGGAQLKMGGNIKKSLYKNKLTFNLRSDLRTQPISYTSNDQWKSLQLQFDSRYLVSKKINVAVKFINNSTDKRIADVTSKVYSFNKLQVDGNATYKIGKSYTFSHITLGGQQLANSYASAGAANVFMLNYTQSIIIKQKTLTFNLFYNKELTASKLIGNMLNSDLSYQFSLSKKLILNSGITYLDNQGIAKQAGIREAVQFASIGHFDIGSFIDVRKNLITPQYADLYASTRAELTITYHVNY